MQINSERLLERFCRYVRVDTQANENATDYPSSPGQLELGRMLAEELREIGAAEVEISPFGIVTALLPPTIEIEAPTIALFAHMDTSPETSGHDVKPVVHRNYNGADIILPGDPRQTIRVDENPELRELVGKTIITSDGTTLLGADNKAGIAAIMEFAATLLENPEIPHGPIRICFTCDEEIGRGVDHVEIDRLGAVAGYTLDGHGQGIIDCETFSADLAVVTIKGINIHPSIAKGVMVNAVRLAGAYLQRLPWQALAPEVTAGRDGFLHPYVIEGGVAETKIRILLRDFETEKLAEQAALLQKIADLLQAEHPGCRINIDVKPQYRNMREGLQKEPRALAYAEEAIRRAGLEPRREIIRGGTDGSRLTELGLPTPNLSTGEHNPHSPLEWTCLEEMVTASRVLIELGKVWCEG